MPLPTTLQDREMQKFDLNDDGEVIVRTAIDGSIEGNFVPSGLNKEGRITQVTINDSSWTPLPGVGVSSPARLGPLTDRNAISIQNTSGYEMKVNYQEAFDGAFGYVGMTLPNSNERYYDIKDSIIIYGRLASGAGTQVINVEELA